MPSFDVVSEVDMQEVRNAVDQVRREIGTRYDFRGSKSKIELKDEGVVEILSEDDMKLRAVQDIFRQKLAKRQISQKSVIFEPSERAGGDMQRQVVKIKQGLQDDELKKLNKMIKGQKMKVTSQIQGDQLRVTGKKRDDLQTVIGFLKENADDLELQFTNFRD
jgi:uncharacterized protein YajQ (UPF0234 family)